MNADWVQDEMTHAPGPAVASFLTVFKEYHLIVDCAVHVNGGSTTRPAKFMIEAALHLDPVSYLFLEELLTNTWNAADIIAPAFSMAALGFKNKSSYFWSDFSLESGHGTHPFAQLLIFMTLLAISLYRKGKEIKYQTTAFHEDMKKSVTAVWQTFAARQFPFLSQSDPFKWVEVLTGNVRDASTGKLLFLHL